ncbi:MAG: isopeptide-forming domain-containing fimbrial protein [Lachnospiraceae bacterium]|nr:isopeptide-forming domain-containing fimbrial protein [Lachnospiraceae bacterium]
MKLKKSRIGALLLAFVLMLSMAFNAYAATGATGSITITGLDETEDVTVSAYQLLEWDSTNGAWKLTDLATTALTGASMDTSEALTTLTTGTSNSNGIAVILTAVAAYVDDNGTMPDATDTSNNSTELTLNTTSLGSYLVVCESNNYVYTNMLVSNYDANAGGGSTLLNASAAVKAVKTVIVESKTASDAEVAAGDVVTYTVTGTFPHFEGTGSPSLTLTDTMDDTLELVIAGVSIASTDITVQYGATGTETTLDTTNYTVEALTGTDNGFKITFDQDWLKTNAAAIAGQTFTLTYRVTVVDASSTNAYTNTITGTVNVEGEEIVIPGTPTNTVYSTTLKLKKVDATSTSTTLSGAVFVLQVGTQYVSQVVSGSGNVTYTLVNSIDDATEFTTANDGTVTIAGLDPELTYTLIEKTAPSGYAKSTNSPTITFTQDITDKTTYTAALLNGGSDWSVSEGESTAVSTVEVTLLDSTMSALPETGGMGIAILTIAGVVLMIAFGSSLVVMRKRSR